MASRYDFASVTSIGKSYEGREMLVLRLEKAGHGKPNIWIEAGIHGREWIAPAMATYIIDQLLNNDKDGCLSKLNFHILPSANPDGYEYSRNAVSNFIQNRHFILVFDKISIYRIECGEKIDVQTMIQLKDV